MDDKTLVREVMKLRGWSQATLAKEAGFKNQSNIASMLTGSANGIRIDNLVRLFNAMGCEVIVRDKMGSRKEWTIDMSSLEEKKKEMQAKKGADEE